MKRIKLILIAAVAVVVFTMSNIDDASAQNNQQGYYLIGYPSQAGGLAMREPACWMLLTTGTPVQNYYQSYDPQLGGSFEYPTGYGGCTGTVTEYSNYVHFSGTVYGSDPIRTWSYYTDVDLYPNWSIPAGLNVPQGVDIYNNMVMAESHPRDLAWFAGQMHEKFPPIWNAPGPWDYKQYGLQYDDFGNFNYGVAAAASGLSLDFALKGAGFVTQLSSKTYDENDGHWYDSSPSNYGDQARDQAWIRKGYDFYQQIQKGCNF